MKASTFLNFAQLLISGTSGPKTTDCPKCGCFSAIQMSETDIYCPMCNTLYVPEEEMEAEEKS